MEVIPTQHDGNCLFEALCLALHFLRCGSGSALEPGELERRKFQLRQEIAHVVCVQRREQFAPFCPHPQRLYEDGEWAGDYEIVAFAQEYQVNVVLYDKNAQWETVLHFPSDSLPYDTTIALLRTDQAHYSLLWAPPPPMPAAAAPPPAMPAAAAAAPPAMPAAAGRPAMPAAAAPPPMPAAAGRPAAPLRRRAAEPSLWQRLWRW